MSSRLVSACVLAALSASGCRPAAAAPGGDGKPAPAAPAGDGKPAPAAPSPMAWRGCDRIELARPVVFRHNWTLDSWSRPALEAAAGLLAADPSIRRVRVEADDLWNDPNRGARVSHNRAESIERFLVGHGVAADRVEAVGFADDRVTARSGAPSGVRLVIVDPPPACPAPADDARDDDLDGLVGAADRCPDVAEDFDARDDTDGCPEPARGHVRLECRDLTLDGPVRLTGRRLTLDAKSRARLADLASILRAAAFVRVVLVQERVHHDPRRDIPPPRRSPVIEDHLASLGISRDRLHADLYSMLDMPAGRYQLTFRVHERAIDCPPPPTPAPRGKHR